MTRDYSGQKLVNHDLSGVNLTGANFDGATLHGCNFSDRHMRNSTFRNAEIGYGTVFNGTDLAGSVFDDAHFIGATFNQAHLNLSSFQRARVSRLELKNSGAVQVTFRNMQGPQLDCSQTNFLGSDLSGCNFPGSVFRRAEFHQCKMDGLVAKYSNFAAARFFECDLSRADLSGSDLSATFFLKSKLFDANISGACVFGSGVWHTDLNSCEQRGLIVTPPDEPALLVDNVQLAQFIYLLANNENLKDVIDTITSKVVLILGRFSPARKQVLDEIARLLRARGFVSVIFDFEKPARRSLTDTVGLLARMSRFVVVDLTDPKSAPWELATLAQASSSLIFHPIIQEGQKPFGMLEDLKSWPNFKQIESYSDVADLPRLLRLILERDGD